MKDIKLNKIKDAIEAIKNGEIIIVVDDEKRENEGDFIAAAEMINSSMINFMAKHGRGLICVPMSENLCNKLKLKKMVPNNTDPFETAFTVSVDLKGNGVTSGISASDRAKTVQALVDDKTKPGDLTRPGHIFPLIAKEGGVLRRTGHTEASIDFSRLAGLKSAAVLCEIMNDDGSMSRLPELFKVAEKFNLKIVSIEDLIAYRMKNDSLISLMFDEEISTEYGGYRLRGYRQTNNNQIHLALTLGEWNHDEPVLVRINSSVVENDILKILAGANDKNYSKIFEKINNAGKGAIIFINQNQEPESILERINKLKDSNNKLKINNSINQKQDFKDFGIGAQIIHDIGISKIKILSNSGEKPRVGLSGYGLSIDEYIRY
ncbi:MAG: 3,4-dihydroxy-2-butanone-4-phosphate synthase [Flavobacteriales bacterium]|jgi:3,4-dihydroxy 2-butanone 4-phosphate synthase/GTP cyclohydrolase II|nr:3,4-dihydroxy-2-butanone-4-phosphate synthase [Flavobacteriales bacterium]|tara:strand:- start:41 stop:1171 length:1131 start_codon:yes stop_codon:yes gene_type:complete